MPVHRSRTALLSAYPRGRWSPGVAGPGDETGDETGDEAEGGEGAEGAAEAMEEEARSLPEEGEARNSLRQSAPHKLSITSFQTPDK